jgi:hypothetical protein
VNSNFALDETFLDVHNPFRAHDVCLDHKRIYCPSPTFAFCHLGPQINLNVTCRVAATCHGGKWSALHSLGQILMKLHASVDIARIRTMGVLVLFDNFAVRSANTGMFANNQCATLTVDSGIFGDFKISPHPSSNVWSIFTYMTEANILCYTMLRLSN